MMRLKKFKRLRGQSIVEYAIIASVLILVCIIASRTLTYSMGKHVEGTAKGFSSKSNINK